MKHVDFVSFVQRQEFLGMERQRFLISNSPWMSEHERDLLCAKITEAGKNIDINNHLMLAEMDRVKKNLNSFVKKELPKIRQENEKSQTASEEEKAAQLLKNFSKN